MTKNQVLIGVNMTIGKLLGISLLVTGCATNPTRYLYTCAIQGSEKTLVNLKISATSMTEATRTAQKIEKRLQEKKFIPKDTYVMCFEGPKLGED